MSQPRHFLLLLLNVFAVVNGSLLLTYHLESTCSDSVKNAILYNFDSKCATFVNVDSGDDVYAIVVISRPFNSSVTLSVTNYDDEECTSNPQLYNQVTLPISSCSSAPASGWFMDLEYLEENPDFSEFSNSYAIHGGFDDQTSCDDNNLKNASVIGVFFNDQCVTTNVSPARSRYYHLNYNPNHIDLAQFETVDCTYNSMVTGVSDTCWRENSLIYPGIRLSRKNILTKIFVTDNMPSLVTHAPTVAPEQLAPPTVLPIPSSVPTRGPGYVNCPAFWTGNTVYGSQPNTPLCKFEACGGSSVTIDGCGCGGDMYLLLQNAQGSIVAGNDDHCGICSFIVFNVQGSPTDCNVYTLREGCYDNESCGGQIAIKGALRLVPAVTTAPTRRPHVHRRVSRSPSSGPHRRTRPRTPAPVPSIAGSS